MRCAPPMRCPEFSRRCALGGRWLVDGALVNPVPVSAARALGARLVIAVNLNSDLLGRGMTMAGDGPTSTTRAAAKPPQSRRGLRAMFGAERALKRQFVGGAAPSRHSDRDGRRLQHHAGPHHARAARRRSAGRHDQPAASATSAGSISTARRRPSRSARAPPSARSTRSPRRSPRWRRGRRRCRRPCDN